MRLRWLALSLACALVPSTVPGRAAGQASDSAEARATSSDTLRRIVPLPEVVVSTSRATDRTPVAKSVLGREEILRANWGQDTPMALATLPGTYAYSDAGNGIGYSYLSIRGFPQRRISVLINGVPLNDPESHEVYWIDHPDLLASTTEAQVQRGVGSALYGAASVGGSVDLETSPFTEVPRGSAALSYGTYRTRRAMLEMNSGRLSGDWSYYGRYSRVDSDGYRDQSWTKVWSYYFSTRKLLGGQMLRLNLFGGPEETHLAYKGVSRSLLNGGLTGDAERDRRYNPLTYPYEADHFFEPHYELMHSWSPRPGLALTQTLFWFDGRGYYDEQRFDALTSYRLAPWAADTTLYPAADFDDGYGNQIRDSQGRLLMQRTNIVRRRTVANQHYGWIPRLRITHPDGELIVGGELRFHDGHHWGEVLSGDGLPPGTASASRYYDYHPRTFSGGLFLREEWRPVASLAVTGDLAWRHQGYSLRGDRFDGNRFDQGYDFPVPRFGATWQLRENLSLFGSWTYSGREPRFVDLFKGERASGVPYYRQYDPARGVAEDPLVHPEKVNDYELGATVRGRGVTASANLFRMDFRDELVDYQFDSNFYDWITTNAARSVHQGFELALATEARPLREFSLALDANTTVSDNHFVDFDERLDATTVVSRDGKTIGFFPGLLVNAAVRLGWAGLQLGAETQHVGEIFLDSSEDPSGHIAPHTVLNLTGGYRLSFGDGAQATLLVRVLNALDKEYEAGGYFDYDEDGNFAALFVPAAKRNVLAELRVGF
ncbi:MAG TPA: TonB-dependent receptor [Candidatus Eisenbacteria bacterium]